MSTNEIIERFRYGVKRHSNVISLSSKIKPASNQISNSKPSPSTTFNESLVQLSSVPLNQRYAEKPSLLVLEQFFQLFLRLFKPESQPPSVLVTIQAGKFGEFVLDSRILPPLPHGASQNALLEEVGMKIQAGGVLYEEIVNRKPASTKPAQLEGISNLMWFLQAKAEQKEGPFTFGAISIEDSQLSLLDYFDTCKEVYKIASSSIEEFQSSHGKERSGVHRGIDFNPTAYEPTQSLSSYLNLVLPHQKRTVLVTPLLKESELIDGNRLLLKMEDHTVFNHIFTREDPPSCSVENNEYGFPNVVDHAWGFIQSLIRTITEVHTNLTTKRERIPPYVSNAYIKFIHEFKRHKLTEFLEILQKDDPLLQSSGIRIMARNIENLTLLSGNPRFPSHLSKPLNDFYNAITDHNKYDYYSVRIGNEVIFNTKDLLVNND